MNYTTVGKGMSFKIVKMVSNKHLHSVREATYGLLRGCGAVGGLHVCGGVPLRNEIAFELFEETNCTERRL